MSVKHAPRAGRHEWLVAMKATLVVCAGVLLVAWLAPSTRPWMPLVLSVLWLRGPIGFLLPVGLEPVLMEYGSTHPVLIVVAVTAVASAAAETISLRVMRGVASLDVLTRGTASLRDSRIVRLFQRWPAAAVAFGALSPVPDWITRSLAAVSGYHPVRYVIADTIGRLPKLWLPAAAGGLVALDPLLTRAFLLSQLLLVGCIFGVRWLRSRRTLRRLSLRRTALSSEPEAARHRTTSVMVGGALLLALSAFPIARRQEAPVHRLASPSPIPARSRPGVIAPADAGAQSEGDTCPPT